MLADWIALILGNFSLAMFMLAAFFMLLNRVVTSGRVSEYEITYRWMALFAVGVTGIYTFVMHAFYSGTTSAAIGWSPSPFETEVAIADLAFGVMGVLSFNASYGFRLATVIGVTIWLWGDAAGHIYQMIMSHNFAPGNAGSWFWMDVIVPLLLIICIRKLKPSQIFIK